MEIDIIQFLMYLIRRREGGGGDPDIVSAVCKKRITMATLTIRAVSQILCPQGACPLIRNQL